MKKDRIQNDPKTPDAQSNRDNSQPFAKPVLAAVLNWCGIIEVVLFVMLLILRVWVEDDGLISKLMATDLILFFATWLFYEVDKYSRENSS